MHYALFSTIQRHYALFSGSHDGTHNHFIQGKTLKMGPTALFKHFKCVNSVVGHSFKVVYVEKKIFAKLVNNA